MTKALLALINNPSVIAIKSDTHDLYKADFSGVNLKCVPPPDWKFLPKKKNKPSTDSKG